MNHVMEMHKNVQKSGNVNTHIDINISNSGLFDSKQGVVTGAVIDYGNAENDKYCLEFQTTLKGEKICMA